MDKGIGVWSYMNMSGAGNTGSIGGATSTAAGGRH